MSACNYKEDLEKISETDWVLEAVVERLDIKEKVYSNLLPHLKETAILTSNTSGIPLSDLAEKLPIEVKKRFMITHFFNPPRYMQLLELVRGEHTTEDTYKRMATFGEYVLGKGIVHAKDTPNFIGNRIGIFGMMTAINLALEHGLKVEEVDKLTGLISGRPKSATFRTADVVGLDIFNIVSLSTYEKAIDDVIAESMACGTPCITTDVGDAAFIVGKTGWVVPPNDPLKLAKMIEKAIIEISSKTVSYTHLTLPTKA